MSQYSYDVTYTDARNRGTVAIRFILAIPHLIVAQIWGYLAQILAVVQWFIALFTGKRNEGIWNMQRQWLDYYARVLGYESLLFDQFPAFGTDPGTPPVVTAIADDEPVNRLTVGLRFLWIIPAAIIAALFGIAAFVVGVVSWFAIIFTGKHPQGMWDFLLKYLKYALQVQAYGLLLTDTYPKL
jgi:hypothetical protein